MTKENVASSLLRNSRVNLWGMGATLLGLQVGCRMSATSHSTSLGASPRSVTIDTGIKHRCSMSGQFRPYATKLPSLMGCG